MFKANGGDKLTLSDILFHTEDPYAAWKNFESPEILFIDLAEDKGSNSTTCWFRTRSPT